MQGSVCVTSEVRQRTKNFDRTKRKRRTITVSQLMISYILKQRYDCKKHTHISYLFLRLAPRERLFVRVFVRVFWL